MRSSDDMQANIADASALIRDAAGQGAQYIQTPENTCLMAPDGGAKLDKTFAEADTEVSEAADFAHYYAEASLRLTAVDGARFEPARLTIVASPWNFPVAIPAGSVLAALAAGSAVVLKPAPESARSAAVLADILWEAGIPRDLLALAALPDGDVSQALVSHTSVDRVVLTGSWDTARLFRSWRPDLEMSTSALKLHCK